MVDQIRDEFNIGLDRTRELPYAQAQSGMDVKLGVHFPLLDRFSHHNLRVTEAMEERLWT